MDKRWYELAEILVNYCTEVKPGENVMIAMNEVETLPLVQACYEKAVQAGGNVQVQFVSDTLRRSLMKYGTPEQVGWLPAVEAYGMDWADAYIGLRGGHNPFEFADIPAGVLARHQAAMGKISSLRWQHTRWVLIRVPDASFAQQAEVDYETMLEFFFSATLQDWPAEARRWERVAGLLDQGREVHLLAPGTDLRFSVAGRKWCVGEKVNMPQGEIYTAPHTETVNGVMSFEWPGVFAGRLVHDIRLEWQNGELVSATASDNEEFLRSVLATDEGATRIGEFAVGTNYGMNLYCKDILLDEKIGGTMHIAMGRAYPRAGGTNQSAIHWDIIKDTRGESLLYLDGKVVFENGRFVI